MKVNLSSLIDLFRLAKEHRVIVRQWTFNGGPCTIFVFGWVGRGLAVAR